MTQAREEAERALELDDSLAEAHTVLAFVKTVGCIRRGNVVETWPTFPTRRLRMSVKICIGCSLA